MITFRLFDSMDGAFHTSVNRVLSIFIHYIIKKHAKRDFLYDYVLNDT